MLPIDDEIIERAPEPAYRDEEPGPGARMPNIADTPIGQTALFEDIEQERSAHSALLTDRFVVPPFSVLDSRAGYWQSRKAQWMALGIRSEIGRGDDLLNLAGTLERQNEGRYRQKPRASAIAAGRGKGVVGDMARSRPAYQHPDVRDGNVDVGPLPNEHGRIPHRQLADASSNLNGAPPLPEYANNGMVGMAPGTSVFDPVLCEVAYRWFAPADGTVLDPFAGGSVRGIIAAMLGHRYTGIDLSGAQVEANRAQADAILAGGHYPPPVWIHGDSAHINRLLTEPMKYDLLFSCPPYYDLEVYGDEPGELSAMEDYPAFLRAYGLIIRLAAERLRDERFAVWVVGEIRDKATGFARGLVSDTIRLFSDAGLHLYNEAVLINAVGTLALRTPHQFVKSRKMGRSHQAVLVFYKGERAPSWTAEQP